MATINGDQKPNNLNDQIFGTSNGDTIHGLKGNDGIFGNGSAAMLYSNANPASGSELDFALIKTLFL